MCNVIAKTVSGGAALIIHGYREPVLVGFVRFQKAPHGGKYPSLDYAPFGGNHAAVVALLLGYDLLFGPECLDEVAKAGAHAILLEGLEQTRVVNGIVRFSEV